MNSDNEHVLWKKKIYLHGFRYNLEQDGIGCIKMDF